MIPRFAIRVVLASLAGCGSVHGAEMLTDGQALVRTYCAGCHRESAPGQFERITAIRKTPEGWVMTLFRMRQVHGLVLDAQIRDALVRYLANTNGLAPAEASAGRFALERRPNAQDLEGSGDLKVMCGRCHSLARVALQRRDSGEWLKLVNMHVGQWPSLEYQASSRDRYWWQTATTQVPLELGALYPLQTAAWHVWQARPHAALDGRWIVYGHTPGRGDYHGAATIRKRGLDEYTAAYQLTYREGTPLSGSSKAIVYTGYEWRGTATLGEESVFEVFALSEDGLLLEGRWFLQDHNEIGGDWIAVRATGPPGVLAVLPRALKSGATQRVTVVGRRLTGTVSFGAGTRARVLARDDSTITLEVAVLPGASDGYRSVSVGGTTLADAVVIYDRVDRVQVEPAYGIARLGGGKLAPVSAQFEAIGYLDFPAQTADKKTEVRLGTLPATWTVLPYDASATRARDIQFAGHIAPTGRFDPAGAGTNPLRQFSGNNVGNLFVVASVQDGKNNVQGKSHLVVTVQRWNTPPIY
ncbi:MAG: quinohemoprotein amine dehydrogenase subunit alpha [Steroidobacteraceae bacterium]